MTTEIADVASDLVAANHTALTDSSLPTGVVEAYADFVEGMAGVRGAAEQMESDIADLNGKKNLLPRAGYAETKHEIVEDVNDRRETANDQTRQAYERLTAELRAAAIPKVEKSRELMDRDELLVSFGRQSGPGAAARAREIAQHSTPSVVALLFTKYGQAVLADRGVAGEDYDQLVEDCTNLYVRRGAAEGVRAAEILESPAFGKMASAGAAADMAFTMKAKRLGVSVRRGWPH